MSFSSCTNVSRNSFIIFPFSFDYFSPVPSFLNPTTHKGIGGLPVQQWGHHLKIRVGRVTPCAPRHRSPLAAARKGLARPTRTAGGPPSPARGPGPRKNQGEFLGPVRGVPGPAEGAFS